MTRFNELIPCRNNSIDDFLQINKLKLIHIIGDGNCFFRTIAKHCYFERIKRNADGIMKHEREFKEEMKKSKEVDEVFLRQKLFDYVKQFILHAYKEPDNHEALMVTLSVMGLDKNSITPALHALRNSRNYSNELFDLVIEYAADAFNMAIHIYSIQDNTIRAAHFMPCVADMPITDIKLHYKNRNHYELLYTTEHDIHYDEGNAFLIPKNKEPYNTANLNQEYEFVNQPHESINNSNALKSTPGDVKCRLCNSTVKIASWKGHIKGSKHIKLKNNNTAKSVRKSTKSLNKSVRKSPNKTVKSPNKTAKSPNKTVNILSKKNNIHSIIKQYRRNKDKPMAMTKLINMGMSPTAANMQLTYNRNI